MNGIFYTGLPTKSRLLVILRPNLKNLSRGLNLSRRLINGWFHLKLYQMFQDLSRRSILTGFWRI